MTSLIRPSTAFAASAIFPGTWREYWVYVPAGLDRTQPARKSAEAALERLDEGAPLGVRRPRRQEEGGVVDAGELGALRLQLGDRIAVLAEGGGVGGRVAAPLAARFLAGVFGKKRRDCEMHATTAWTCARPASTTAARSRSSSAWPGRWRPGRVSGGLSRRLRRAM